MDRRAALAAIGLAAIGCGCGAARDGAPIAVRAEARPRQQTPARDVRFGAAATGTRFVAMATRWVSPLTWHPEVGRIAGVTAEHVVLEAGDDLVVHDLATGAPHTYPGTPGVVTAGGDTIVTLPILAPSVGIDPRDGRIRWSHRARMQPSIEGVPLAVSSAGVLVITGAELPTTGTTRRSSPVVALDPATGEARWTVTEVDARALLAAGDHVYLATWDSVVARDARTSRELWRWSPAWSGRQDCLGARPLLVSGDALVTARECGRIVVLDRATGALRGELDVEGDIHAMDVSGHVAYAALVPNGPRSPESSRGVLRAIDLTTSRTLWEKGVSGLDARTLLRVAGGAAVLASRDGRIEAFELASGSQRTSYRIPGVVDMTFVRRGAVHLDRWLLLARTRSGRIFAVEPRDSLPPDASVRIRGQVTLHDESQSGRAVLAGARVLLDGHAPITLDRDGRFERVVHTRGAVSISIDPRDIAAASASRPMGCFELSPSWVMPEIDGPEAEVSLVLFCAAPC